MISYIKTELMKEKRSANLKLGIIVPIIFVLLSLCKKVCKIVSPSMIKLS